MRARGSLQRSGAVTTALACVLAASLLACRKEPVAAAQREGPEDAPAPSAAAVPARPCLYFTQLRSFLPPELAGYTQARDEGSTGKYGEVAVSEAERVFAAAEGRSATVRIVDTSMSEKLGNAIRAAVKDARDRDPAAATAPIVLADAQGFVRYDPDASKAEANLLVGDRFVVAVTTFGFEGTDELRRIALGLNLAGLSKLR